MDKYLLKKFDLHDFKKITEIIEIKKNNDQNYPDLSNKHQNAKFCFEMMLQY